MTDQQIFEIAALVYHKWSERQQIFNAVKKETDDGSPDWAEFHVLRLDNARKEAEHWAEVSTAFNNDHRDVLGRI